MTAEDEVSRFIRSSLVSVWSLELLFMLKRERVPWKRSHIVAALRASDLIVSRGLIELQAAGLVAEDEEGAVYRPVSEALALLVEKTETFYARSPDAVRRLIVGAASSGLAAFADAFRIRKD
ncbi:MAG: hypothetical protein ACJ8ER_04235 [Allosphingosinicella sp.]